MAAAVNHRAMPRSIASRLSQTRDDVPNNWEMVRIGMASLGPNAHTKTGRVTTPPPNPATPEMVNPTTPAAITRTI